MGIAKSSVPQRQVPLMAGVWTSGPSRRRGLGENTVDRRPRLKALAAASAQERRRQDCLSKQKQVSEEPVSAVSEQL